MFLLNFGICFFVSKIFFVFLLNVFINVFDRLLLLFFLVLVSSSSNNIVKSFSDNEFNFSFLFSFSIWFIIKGCNLNLFIIESICKCKWLLLFIFGEIVLEKKFTEVEFVEKFGDIGIEFFFFIFFFPFDEILCFWK